MPRANPIENCAGCLDAAVRAALPEAAQCSACRKKERNRIWRLANPGAMAANAKKWREAGNKTIRPDNYAELHRVKMSERYHNNAEVRAAASLASKRQRARLGKDELNRQNKEWRDKNPGKHREYYLAGLAKLLPDERRERGKEHRERYRYQRQAGQAAYYARRYGGTGVITNEHLVGLHKWQDHCCFYCHTPLKGAETIEHVVPLSRGGSNNPWNVTLVCADCNTRKQASIFGVEWAPSEILPAPRYHSIEGMRRLKQALTAESVAHTDADTHLMIGERSVFMLSSFWLGWAGDSVIADIKKNYPTSIIFFDKEFVKRPDAVINVLKAKGGVALRTGARQLSLIEPTTSEAREFIGRWHAMGPVSGTHYLGLRDADRWWAIAAFRKEMDHYEVSRMAIRDTVAGGVSRIMRRFQETMPEQLPIVAFTDQRMGDGKSHFFAGFIDAGMTERSFFYATPEVDGFYPRRDFQKQVLEAKAEFFDPTQTQVVNALANGLMRVEGLPRLKFALDPA